MNKTGQEEHKGSPISDRRIVTGIDGKPRKIGRLVQGTQPQNSGSGAAAKTRPGEKPAASRYSRQSELNKKKTEKSDAVEKQNTGEENDSFFRVKRLHKSPAAKPEGNKAEVKKAEGAEKEAEAERKAAEKKAEAEKKAAEKAEKEAEAERKAAEKAEKKAAEKAERAEKKSENEPAWKEKVKIRNKKRRNIILIIIGVILLAAYTAVAVYYSSHFYNNTVIYGLDCSGKTLEEVKADIHNKLQDYSLTIQERDGIQEKLSAGEVGLVYADDGSLDAKMKNQLSFIWPITMFLDHSDSSEVSFAYNTEQAENALNLLNCMNPIHMVAPKDAYLDITDQGFEVVKEVMGTKLDKEHVIEIVEGALDTGKTEVSLEEEGCYINPEIYSDNEELQSLAEEKNRLAGANITFDFGDRKEVVDPKLLDSWLVQMPDGSFVLDDMKVTNFVTGLAEKYDTLGRERIFHTSLGEDITLYYGDYGWSMNTDATLLKLLNAIQEGYHGVMEPEYYQTAMCRDENDIGDTYVEIDISKQTMWCYQDGNLIVTTPVVTGKPNKEDPEKDNSTPSWGVWAIDDKKRDFTLVGEGYEAPVDYWLPFNGNVGIHDLQSRGAFGGDIYKYAGSHGCINTPYYDVATIYQAVSKGTPVCVYGE